MESKLENIIKYQKQQRKIIIYLHWGGKVMARKYEVRSHWANDHNQQLAKKNEKITDTENNVE